MSGATPLPIDGGAGEPRAERLAARSRGALRVVAGSGRADSVASTDAELIERTRDGDREAFGQLVERHHRTLSAVLYQRFGPRAPVEDLVQETFVRVLQNLDRFRGSSGFLTWATSIALNLARDDGRRSTRRRRLTPGSEVEPDEVAREEERSGPALAELRDEAERARAALDALPDAQRLAVTLRVVEDAAYPDIAARLGTSIPSARTWVSRGLARLRRQLGEEET